MRCVRLLVALGLTLTLRTAPAETSGKAVGVPDAPILMEVFSDYQCPACKMLYEHTLLPMMEDYVRRGKVYLIHREFPLTMHAYSRQAAYYACAAERIGKYEQVATALFAKQTTWAADGKVDEAACSVLTPAEANKVRALVKDVSVTTEVERDAELGARAKVSQTPTIIITHRLRQYPLTGSIKYDLLRSLLDDLLTK